MPWRDQISPDTKALAEAIKGRRRASSFAWLPGLVQAVLSGLIGAGAAIYGAYSAQQSQIALAAQRDTHEDKQQVQRDNRTDQQFLLDKAERVISLVEKTVVTNAEITQSILAMPSSPTHTASLPDDPEQVTALVTLYFPSAVGDARVYESKCAEHIAAVQEILMNRLAGKPPSTADNKIYQDALTAGDRVIDDVMRAVGRPYERRVPLSPGEMRKLDQHQRGLSTPSPGSP